MGAVDYFLKVEGIEGESQDSSHRSEIQISSFGWGAHQIGTQSSGGGGGAGRVTMDDFAVVKSMDKASPKLMHACASGEHIPKCTLTARKAGGSQQEYLKIIFTDVLISSYRTSGNTQEAIPMEDLTLNFAQIEVEYKEQRADGTMGGAVRKGWNLRENRSV